VGFFFELRHESSCPRQGRVEIVDTKEQEKTVAGLGAIGARQRGMLVGAPLVKTEQDGSIRVEDLSEVVMCGSRFLQAKQRLIPSEAASYIGNSNDRPCASHARSLVNPIIIKVTQFE
jgi:hypothetical protein